MVWKVQLIPYRDTNKITHTLAKFAYNLDENHFWIEDYPSIVTDLIQEVKLCIDSAIE